MLAGASLIALDCTSAMAQQVTGVPSPPEATITGNHPDPKFGGVIKVNASDSKAWWAARGCLPI
jgi:hypothetical protein